MLTGGEKFFAVVEDFEDRWKNPISKRSQHLSKFIPGSAAYLAHIQQERHVKRTQMNVADDGNGTYTVFGTLYEQGIHDLR